MPFIPTPELFKNHPLGSGWQTLNALLENKKMIKKLAFKNDVDEDEALIHSIRYYVIISKPRTKVHTTLYTLNHEKF